MIVVPDVGCGVFGNDPLVIGGCWGAKEVSMLMLLLIQACSMKRYDMKSTLRPVCLFGCSVSGLGSVLRRYASSLTTVKQV